MRAVHVSDVVEVMDKATIADRVLAIVDTCLAIDRSAATLVYGRPSRVFSLFACLTFPLYHTYSLARSLILLSR
jgi:hypothetical protein